MKRFTICSLFAALAACLLGLSSPRFARSQGVERLRSPSSETLDVALPRLITPAWLGVVLKSKGSTNPEPRTGTPTGALIKRVMRGSPADQANLRADDRIVSVDGIQTPSARELIEIISRKRPGQVVRLGVVRQKKSLKPKTLKLAEQPTQQEMILREWRGRRLNPTFKLPIVHPNEAPNSDSPRYISLPSSSEKPVVLDFWASWCGPCLKMTKALQNLVQDFDQRVQFVGLSSESKATIQTYARKHDLSLLLAHDPLSKVHDMFFVRQYPTFVLISPKGDIVYAGTGLEDIDVLRTQITRMLAEDKP